jgi:NADPH:quinone reductase-like Zn-dependent oxidoreductase
MRAVAHTRYGSTDGVELREVERPAIEPHQVLLRVHATSVNPAEWYRIIGPFFARFGGGLRRPKSPGIGADVAGTVEAVGADVTEFQPGDEVFGTSGWAWAEHAAAREVRLVRKPANVSFQEAGAVPIAAITALQALRDHGGVQAGQKVLINGASGGVGTYAVQLAKVFGAEVTAVCSTRNVEQARALGADVVCDYTAEDFTRSGERFDLAIDIAGSRSLSELRRVLTPNATLVLVGAKMKARGLGPLPHLFGTMLAALPRSQKAKFFVAKINKEDLAFLAEQMADGNVKSVVDRTYDLSQIREALAYFGEGHARGKVVVTA